MDTKQKLDQLAELYAQRDLIAVEKQKLLDTAMPEEVRKAIADINTEFAPKEAAISEVIDNTTADVKADVIADGMSVKGNFLHAVFTSGRVSWDTRGLDGYAAAHPEVAQFKKQGDPSVAIRKV